MILKKALIIMLSVEAISFLAFNFPVLSLPLLIIAGAATLFFASRQPEWGIYILFGELFSGSRGHLLEYDFGFLSISLRLVIFASVFLVWASSVILTLSRAKGKNPSEIKRSFGLPQDDKITAIYCLLILAIVFGIANGFLHGHSLANIFNDANGYLYLLILPAVVSAIKTRAQLENLLQILAAAILVIAVKTLTLFIWFTFDFPGVAPAYHWVINHDFGEITGEVGSASRIFMQSQFYALMGLFIFSLKELPSGSPLYQRGDGGVLHWAVISAALLSIIMSLSRSFWLGAAAGGMFAILVVLWRFRPNFRAFFTLGLKLGLVAILEIALLYGIIAISGGGVSEAVTSRGIDPSKEAAGSARLLLLPELARGIKRAPLFGSGLGQPITYKSYLPDRITSENPAGEISSFAFEWGYLDTLLKVGAVGLVMYLLFIAHIFRLGWENFQFSIFNFQTLGLLAGLAALLTLNITTPYLNHPLGIGFLIFVYSYLLVIRKADESVS